MNSQKEVVKRQRRGGLWRYRWNNYKNGYLFMLPWAIGFSVFVAFPVGWSLFNSFHNVKLRGGDFQYEFVGLNNFRRILMEDNVYPVELLLYFQEMLLIIPLILFFSFIVSLLLNQKFAGRGPIRAIFFLPVIFATGQVLMELFGQGAGELPFIEQYNLEGLIKGYVGAQLADPIMGVLGKAVIILWYSGVQILIFIAGYQTIPRTVYEAIRIDGATPWESFWKITLPGMIPFIGLNAVFTIVDLFTFPMNPVMEQVSKNMFDVKTGYGYASAQAWLYFALILLLLGVALLIAYRSTLKRGVYR
ncbi:ABC transporter permease [Paenibacillus baekrokdamisoli]|uniref:ABC transporter permease n=1 Tax=Paenibacillus baekrokdamisoli TaxID=1712516 RepID=A0A3G9IT21_9BACL|nr:sugar ABC transporter permease [Paenibacillus baekrokdamisoli]MBB3070401.1 ABC-type sugar transport system permease subunit [Paenibacillus baekrokdamisoli]BBH21402.1 ABC transporter permease [Paenibacillus baekrokdamisoli]